MGKIKVFPFFPYLMLVFFLRESAVWGQDYYFDLEDDSTPFYYQETFSVEELLETDFDHDISNDIDVDICKSSKYSCAQMKWYPYSFLQYICDVHDSLAGKCVK